MPEETQLREYTQNTKTLKVGDYLYTKKQFANIPKGTYLRLKTLYEADGVIYAALGDYANATGPEYDLPAQVVTNALGSKLSFREYDSQMHD